MRYLTPFPVVCSCGRVYTLGQWQELRLCGYQTDAVEDLEIRDCSACKSSQSVPVDRRAEQSEAAHALTIAGHR